MTAPSAKLGSRRLRPDWLPRLIVVPSLLSVLAHGMLLLLSATMLRSCQQAPVGFTTEKSLDVGIVVKTVGDNPDAVVPGRPKDGDPTPPTDVVTDAATQHDSFAPIQATPDRPPVDTGLPQDDSLPGIGPGLNLPIAGTVMDPRQPVKTGGGSRPAASGVPGGIPGTAFMGTQDQGSKIVFVIDASGSMLSHNSMQVAKAALVSSIQALEGNQQFVIIFYDDQPSVLNLREVQKPQLYAATEIHKTLAKQKITGIQPGTGTQHVPALEMALRLKPDVIFFLTDAQEPPIYEVELESLRKLNGQKTRIHSIEFGVGPEISEAAAPGNFLRKLSRQNGGTYRYHDVTRFKPR